MSNLDDQVLDAARPPGGRELAPADVVHSTQLPAPLPPRPVNRRIRWMLAIPVLAVLLIGGDSAYYWWTVAHPRLPAGISFGNGRIEAEEIDIDTKYAGRISELFAEIGDMVSPGQTVARMDTRDLQQSLSKSEAQGRAAEHAVEEARANLVQQQTQKLLAQLEMDRANNLLKNGWTTQEIVDQRKQALDAAIAGLNVAQERISQTQHALAAAEHDAGYFKVEIADNTLTAPKLGRIQYRLANLGEVLPAGGKVFTMLDFTEVYMDIYLPTQEAGKVKVGSDARIVLDAYPDHPIPAKVSFVASQAQFTPKTVETKTERDKLMFRIRARIDEERLRTHIDAIRSGLPGLAYIRWDQSAAWPKALQGSP